MLVDVFLEFFFNRDFPSVHFGVMLYTNRTRVRLFDPKLMTKSTR